MKDDDRPGRPRTAVTGDNIEKVPDSKSAVVH
jgi:hypothetical protein